jgi:tetratricopeptide (TPR) repeat protein
MQQILSINFKSNYTIFGIVLWLLCVNNAYAGTLTFERANQLYHNQQYTEALELYSQMIHEGVVSESVYYNAGNTYFKLNQLGNAVWCYEKAKQFNTDNLLVNENLAYVKSKLSKEAIPPPSNMFKTKVGKLLFKYTNNQLAIFALIAFVIGTLIFFIRKIKMMPVLFMVFRKVSLFLFMIFLSGAIGQYVFIKKYKYGIIITDTILYNNPKEKGLQKKQATQGCKIEIIDFSKGTVLNPSKYKIRRPNGLENWVDVNAVKIL